MPDFTTYKAENLPIRRAGVSQSVWREIIAGIMDPEENADADIVYIDADCDISFELDEDGGCDWSLDAVDFEPSPECLAAIEAALDRHCSQDITAECAGQLDVSWHQSTPWHGAWRLK